ncbi:hypothetical protein GCM10017790_35740 [Amycolatopsis oliviviridis]|uniref:site-specific DNA-methyltransferase (adenine-specific) n=2 Tax=Amycolatopsis oliviviridis TaxID=1471590 RepID=A0ABQ3LN54_9PSEU|nr:hypothetical protein GCM10017790_35740 [Amycolatopsis oliviviridis]
MVAEKLGRGGQEEDQLRGPVEILLRRLSVHIGLDAVAYGEVDLKDIRARPDYAVDVGNSRIGYIELKAPGRNIPPDWRPNKREKEQWEKLKSLPNIIYTDGINWRRFSFGEPRGSAVRLAGSLTNSRNPLHPEDHKFELLVREFLLWEPEQPRTLMNLIKITAGLCRLLRDEVEAILGAAPQHAAYDDLTLLADDWRDLLFPDLDDGTFSDAYAQTVTFAMLLARINGINFDNTPVHEIARQLGKKHSLIGKSFAVLTDNESTEELRIVETLRRVIGAVDWAKFDDGKTNIYIELYEQFLAEYDAKLRKKSGSYYTPEPVARFMVDFVDEILRKRLKRPWGFAADDVVVVDPAMGTGTFLVEVIRAVADTIDEKQGEGARPARLRELFQKRLVGFERQVAPYAVAELRLHQALKMRFNTDIPRTEARFLTDALENPEAQQGRIRSAYKIIERSRAEANRIKREAQVMVIIGNPPHVENARGHASWIEDRRKAGPPSYSANLRRPSLDEFRAAGQGRYESDLHALHWYFWRWALWKVFDAHQDQPTGIVAFVTPSSYTTGKAFAGMREYLRRTCDEGWIINVSPEGNRSNTSTRIFGDVQRQLCIGVFARYGSLDRNNAADVHFLSVSGTQLEKFNDLQSVRLDISRWKKCSNGWQLPFLPREETAWDSYPQLCDLMPWTARGVTTGRAWVYAPDPHTLSQRWSTLIRADTERRRILFNEARDRNVHSIVAPLPGFTGITRSIAEEDGEVPDPVRVGYRSFDRQWIIPDNRLMAVARPPLWAVRSDRQVYITEQNSHPINVGPGITFTSLIPDLHHYNVRAGRVLPLYRDAGAISGNFSPGLIELLKKKLRIEVSGEDLLAYIAAVAAHSGYTAKFRKELQRPGIRIPLTTSRTTWNKAVELGRNVVWLHTYGERYVDNSANRPNGLLELVERTGPRVMIPIPDTSDEMPNDFFYEPESQTLHLGAGQISPISKAAFEYEVSGLKVVRKWIDYRLAQPRHKRRTSPLDDINCSNWTRQFTDELLMLLTILENCIKLEHEQEAILEEILHKELVDTKDLQDSGVLPAPVAMTKPPRIDDAEKPHLF